MGMQPEECNDNDVHAFMISQYFPNEMSLIKH